MQALKTIQHRIILNVIIIFFSFFGFLVESFPQQLYANIGNFKLESGDVIPNCKIGYRVFGAFNSDSSNAVLFPTWFGGFSEHLAGLIGPGKLVDSTKYFVIAVDALGNGISSSPTNSGMENHFPAFSMRDIVNAEFMLVTETLKLKKLFGAIGGSMGGMQVLQLVVSYPDLVSRAIAYVPTPWASSYDKLLWQTRYEFLSSARKCGMPEREIMKIISLLTQNVARTPDYFVKNNPRENFDSFIKKYDKEPSQVFTSLDYMYQLKTMIEHDVLTTPGVTKVNLKERIKTKMFLIIAEKDIILHPSSAKEFASLIGAKTLLLESDCGHLSVNCEMEKVVKAIEDFFNE